MPIRSSLVPLIVAILILAAWTKPVAAQKPAPVEDVSSFPPRTPEEERKALHVPPGLRDPARRGRAGHPQAAQPGLRRPRPALGHRHGRVSLPAPGRDQAPRHRQDPLELRPDGQGPHDPDLRRRPEHPDRPACPALRERGARPQHPEHLPDARHRRRRPGRHARGPLWHLRPPRHARHDQRLHLGLRRLDLRLPRLLQRLDRSRAATRQADHA